MVVQVQDEGYKESWTTQLDPGPQQEHEVSGVSSVLLAAVVSHVAGAGLAVVSACCSFPCLSSYDRGHGVQKGVLLRGLA
jgi:hypothetical protein